MGNEAGKDYRITITNDWKWKATYQLIPLLMSIVPMLPREPFKLLKPTFSAY